MRVSIRNLVEFVMRGGDLDASFMISSRAVEGTRIHQKLQRQNEKYAEENNILYHPEYTLNFNTEVGDNLLELSGRADGIFIEPHRVVIEEIKTVNRELHTLDAQYNPLHFAQAKCYAYIYAQQENLKSITVRLTYCQVETLDIKSFEEEYSTEELKNFFYKILESYSIWIEYESDWIKRRDESLKVMEFPFASYRRGQRALAVECYKAIRDKRKLFAKAPTGIGKTISTLFPAAKALGENIGEKIFYLTAKNITSKVALEGVEKLMKGGGRLKTIVLTSKDKICFNEEAICNAEQCSYARGHFDRVNDALISMLRKEEIIDRDIIEKYAREYSVCPFEFSLDASLWADLIICDYNYVFDPRVYLKRFFSEGDRDFIFLVDEAHNLVDRARDMYSSEISKGEVLKLKNNIKYYSAAISKALNKVNKVLLEYKRASEEAANTFKEPPLELYKPLREFMKEAEIYLVQKQHKLTITKEENNIRDQLLELYFKANNFLKIGELYDSSYLTYAMENNGDFVLKLFCINPAENLKNAAKKGKCSIYFSATLYPQQYYIEMLGGSEEDKTLNLPSPFSKDNLKVLVVPSVVTRYSQREASIEVIPKYLRAVVESRRGNYLVFFPSHSYMKRVYSAYVEEYGEENTLLQREIMDNREREEFLDCFKEETNILGFGVLGGVFSEGIDLRGDKLLGAVIVGVGLPQIGSERDIIRNHFDQDGKGFEYAYQFPGINKVLQAAGRVIRTEEDRGLILLLDQRFAQKSYERLLPPEWNHKVAVFSPKEVKEKLQVFWGD